MTTDGGVMHDCWHGLYREGWGDSIVPDAFSHPAKFRPALIRHIYEHMLGEGWLKPGDRVLDPFGGVALGGLHAMHNGLHWVGLELETRFVALGNANINLWNERYGPLFPGWGTAVLLQGDSRKLLEVLRGEVEGCVSSPPYEGSISHDAGGSHKETWINEYGGGDIPPRCYGDNPSNLGNLTGGFDAAVASPPYAESMERCGGIDPSKSDHIGGPHSQMNRSDTRYGGSDGQLGAMPEGPFDAAVSSPPFGAAETRDRSPYQGGFVGDMMGRAYTQSRQGETEGNLGGMETRAEDFEGVVSSPPFESSLESQDRSFQAKARPGRTIQCAEYGDAEGQLGAMRGGFEGAVSSPPYEASRVDNEFQRQANDPAFPIASVPEHIDSYGAGSTRRTIESIDTFWSAARTIVEQVYAALVPGGHAVWVTKAFVRNGERVDFPGQWRQLCEAVGFVTLHEHHAMLIEQHGTQLGFFEDDHLVTERKSFFRRLAESKGSPPIDWETVWCMQKPEQAALWT